MIYSAGFLLALDYIKQAVVARRELLGAQASDDDAAANRTAAPAPTLDIQDKQTAAKPTTDIGRSR